MCIRDRSYEHQGRKIESARMNNLTDAYVVNGWESELTENYSGIVAVSYTHLCVCYYL